MIVNTGETAGQVVTDGVRFRPALGGSCQIPRFVQCNRSRFWIIFLSLSLLPFDCGNFMTVCVYVGREKGPVPVWGRGRKFGSFREPGEA